MDAAEFRKRGKEMVDYLATYMETLNTRRVTPEVEPGYLRSLLPDDPPKTAEDFDNIMKDVERAIMPGITHWQHPHFHAYFPAGNSFPSILGDMLSDVIGCIGFSWAASPACTELELLVCDWVGKLVGLPRCFLHESGEGGGVIQGSASECVLVALLAARHAAIKRLKVRLPFAEDGALLSKLVAYSSKVAHSCVEKAGMIGFVKMRQLEVDDEFSLRGHILESAIEEDRRLGLIPFFVCATLGTTACCSFDNVAEVGEVCARENLWLHVDAAYAGNALICPEFHYLIEGIENCSSFNFNTNKWLQVNHDCSLMWVRKKDDLTSALTVDPLYLQHKHGNHDIDLRHWGIPLSRRFRALKLWFVLRMYGVEKLQTTIREQIELAKLFEKKVVSDDRFEVHGNVTMGLVCFRLQGPNTQSIRLLKLINESGKLHMVPALLNELYVIRFAICAQNATEDDVNYAWDAISALATELLAGQRDSSKEGGGGEAGTSSESVADLDDEVFNTDFDDEFIFDNQRCHVRRSHQQRSLFFKMVSDPKSYHPRVLRLPGGRQRSYSLDSHDGAAPVSAPAHKTVENGHLPNGGPSHE
ncbi:aromatic-L-amino-acid decarboxylase-like [Babylonia areolata]|uniref:aromatic-L-amino-acid decarboxylase-like n=1 Tax=Babylonia areolata TaxID=304850 RepID=UPI003FD1590D